MWLFTTYGTFSIVEDRNDANRLLVRCRAKRELKDLLKGAGLHRRWRQSIWRDRFADYEFRISLPRSVVSTLLACAAEGIDYDNFKDAVKDKERVSKLHRVWAIMGGADALDRWRQQRNREPITTADLMPLHGVDKQ